MACDISNRLRGVDEISVAELKSLTPGKVVLIDVRPDEERNVSVIPGALSSEVFERDMGTFEGRTPVAYCTAGYRSGLYVQKMSSAWRQIFSGSDKTKGDYSPMQNLRGGILEWCHEGGELVSGDGQPTNNVHVYSKAWNLLPAPYNGVW